MNCSFYKALAAVHNLRNGRAREGWRRMRRCRVRKKGLKEPLEFPPADFRSSFPHICLRECQRKLLSPLRLSLWCEWVTFMLDPELIKLKDVQSMYLWSWCLNQETSSCRGWEELCFFFFPIDISSVHLCGIATLKSPPSCDFVVTQSQLPHALIADTLKFLCIFSLVQLFNSLSWSLVDVHSLSSVNSVYTVTYFSLLLAQ